MNGFRVAILVLLCLVVGLMAYVVFEVLPDRQTDYNLYNMARKNAGYDLQEEAHRERLDRYGDATDPDLQAAQNLIEENERKAEIAVNEAEEKAVIEEVKRREETERALAAQGAAPKEESLGRVASYNEEWRSILVEPLSNQPISTGLVVAVRRDGRIVCEATVDILDESGQFGASIKDAVFSQSVDINADSDMFTPKVGDEVIISPFPTASQLRSETSPSLAPGDTVQPTTTPIAPEGKPEIDAVLTPVPS